MIFNMTTGLKLMLKFAVIAMAVLVSACEARGQNAPVTVSSQPSEAATNLAQIRANLDAWLAAFNAKDVDALMALYDEDSSYAGASGPYISGLENIRERYAAGFDFIDGTLLFQEEKAIAGEDMGLLVGKYYFQPPTTSLTAGPTGRVALVYRKQADGSWKLLFDMDNVPPDVSPDDFR